MMSNGVEHVESARLDRSSSGHAQARDGVDVLMVTYRRPHYTRLSLKSLLEAANGRARVWLWHNGDDEETLGVVREVLDHPSVHRFHHSRENVGLREPTNWLWREATGRYLSKVDDDVIHPMDWIERLVAVHEANPSLGAIACWRFQDEDFLPDLAQKKLVGIEGGTQLLRNCWVQGSGYLLKATCVEEQGLLTDDGSFTQYCNRLAERGWVNGFPYPFISEDHMDDPRSPNTALRTDADLAKFAPIGAIRDSVTSLEDWLDRVRSNAFTAQFTSPDPKWLRGWRGRLTRRRRRRLWEKKWRSEMMRQSPSTDLNDD